MLVKLRIILAYCDWLALVAFLAVFGALLWEKTAVGAVVAFAVALFMFAMMIHYSSKKYSPERRVSAGTPLGHPLVDCGLAVFAFAAWAEAGVWTPLMAVGSVMVGIDFLLWAVKLLETK